jgi:acetylornithine deacetylase/succinyl-diaminopimelate desuccinylase-like protein
MSTHWESVKSAVEKTWDESIIPTLKAYIEIPNQSPHYDPEWATNGLIEKAMNLLIEWMKKQPVKGLKFELLEEKGRTPFLIVEVDGTTPTEKTLFMYGHMDKQPPLLPWSEGLGPYTPVVRDNKLYGRGGADDGYAICAAVTSIAVLQQHNIPHGRIVIVIEACEESGSFDLPHYINMLKPRIGDVNLVVCLDSGALNYDQVWLTSSLRGVSGGVLTVKVLEQGMHSGIAGGVVPDSFRIIRQLIDRVEDSATGKLLVPEAYCDIPQSIVKGMDALNEMDFVGQFALSKGVQPAPGNNVELALNNFWRPCLTVTGCNLPVPDKAGNVIRSQTSVKLSIRTPPKVNARAISLRIGEILEANPPHGAIVTWEPEAAASGWCAPELKPWLENSLNEASNFAFGKPFAVTGLGGSIPFMGMLGEMYPEAQFIVTGVLGPQSNAHGPDEFLHIPFSKGINVCVAKIVADHYKSLA